MTQLRWIERLQSEPRSWIWWALVEVEAPGDRVHGERVSGGTGVDR